MKDPKLNPDDVDNLGQAILSLTEELWVVKDRQKILEAALEQSGIIAAGAIDAHQPDRELEAQLRQQRQQLVDNVLAALRKSAD